MSDDLKISIKVNVMVSDDATEDMEVLSHQSDTDDGACIDIILGTKFAEWLLQIDFDLEAPFDMHDLGSLLERFHGSKLGVNDNKSIER